MTDITSEIREYYKWDTANFTWNDPESNKDFDHFGTYKYTQSTTENISLIRLASHAVSGAYKTGIQLSDSFSKGITANLTELLTVSETYWDNIGFIMHFVESILLDEHAGRHFSNPQYESMAMFEDGHKNSLDKNIVEFLPITELMSHYYEAIRQHEEQVVFVESFNQTTRKKSLEGIGVTDTVNGELAQLVKESVLLEEWENHKSKVIRLVEELLTVGRNQSGAYTASKYESFGLRDALMKACDGVISDIGIYRNGIDLDKFLKIINQPSGYEQFIPYVVGEYEYEKALVRLLIKRGGVGSQPVVYDAVVNVDIDDTVDRGTSNITDTSAPTKIYFNKHYYTKPEVAVTLNAGNTVNGVITPNITEISKDSNGYYFAVELVNSNGQRVTGRITWNSVGY